jgi:transcriptional regulator with XRE-family HTH domain
MDVSGSYFRNIMKSRLADSCLRNRYFSMRSFAKKLGISVSTLSRVLSGQRPLPLKHLERIATVVTDGDEEKRLFLDSAARDLRERAGAVAGDQVDDVDYLEAKSLAWQPSVLGFTILEMTFLAPDGVSADEIIQRTGLSAEAIDAAIQSLCIAGLLVRSGDRYQKSNRRLHLRQDEESFSALAGFHREFFQFAADRMPVRDQSKSAVATITLPANSQKMELAKLLIEDFAWQLCRVLSAGDKDDIYHLGIFLEPATSRKGSES